MELHLCGKYISFTVIYTCLFVVAFTCHVYIFLFSYRSIPLLSEMREVIDWMFTDSTLSFRQWLRVQEIWAEVYLVKVRRMREQVKYNGHYMMAYICNPLVLGMENIISLLW